MACQTKRILCHPTHPLYFHVSIPPYFQAREVQRRQAAALQRNAEARAAEEQSVRAHGARAQRAAAAAEKDAAQDAALQPELEELEIGWVLVRRAAGGGDVPDVVSHWQGATVLPTGCISMDKTLCLWAYGMPCMWQSVCAQT